MDTLFPGMQDDSMMETIKNRIPAACSEPKRTLRF